MADSIREVATLAAEALPGARIHDLFVADGTAALRWTHRGATGLSLLRFETGVIVQSWSAARPADIGPWPGSEEPADFVELASLRARADPTATRSAMSRYCEIRANQSRADELRELFVDPMVVHGSGPTRVENMDEFVARVRAE